MPIRNAAGAGRPLIPFADLTERGRARRLRRMALAALTHYDLDVRRVSLIANHLNGLFRVDTVDGAICALRISHPTWRTDDDLRSELLWLQALGRDTDIGAPVPVFSRSGDLVVTVRSDGVPEPRRCVVMSWLPGVELAKRLSERGVFQLGLLAARLHSHAAEWTPPTDFAARTMTGIYARGGPDVLFNESALDAMAGHDGAVLERANIRVSAAYSAVISDPRGLHVIHGDLHQGNVKVFRGRLRPLDFEDTILGHPVQDIAATFGDLLFYTQFTNQEYLQMRDAFTRGYCSHRPWPEAYPGQIDALMAGRLIWRANFVVRFERLHAPAFIAWAAARLRAFLEDGVLLK